jgi:uncharacterized protein YbjQ (UPF0145 family)
MSLFNKDAHDDWRRKRSQEQLALGGLPLNAERRIRTLAENPRLFTTTFSVNEFVSAQKIGLIPCGQVTGTSVYHTGWPVMPVYTSGEITPLCHAQTQARRLALSRMLQEAQRLGADGVIDVQLTRNTHNWGKDGMEFTAIGTAIRWPQHRIAEGPFACMLTGQEVLALSEAGYRPVGLTFGVSVYYQVASNETTRVMQSGIFNSAARINQEMTQYRQGLDKARRHATECLEEDAACHHAEGIVGISIEKNMEVREVEIEIYERKVKRRDLLVMVIATGTLIRRTEGAGDTLPVINAALPLTS